MTTIGTAKLHAIARGLKDHGTGPANVARLAALFGVTDESVTGAIALAEANTAKAVDESDGANCASCRQGRPGDPRPGAAVHARSRGGGGEADHVCLDPGPRSIDRGSVHLTQFWNRPAHIGRACAWLAPHAVGSFPPTVRGVSSILSGRRCAPLARMTRTLPGQQVRSMLRHAQPRNLLIASVMASAALCWKTVVLSSAASVEFCMFPHSIRTLGTVVKLRPARSSRFTSPLVPS